MFKTHTTFKTSHAHDGLVIGIFEKSELHLNARMVDEQLNSQLTMLRKAGKRSAKLGVCTSVYTLGKLNTEIVYVLGLGKQEDLTAQGLREAIAGVGKEAVKNQATDLGFLVDSFVTKTLSGEDAAILIGESIALSTYRVQDYKEKTNEVDRQLDSVTIYINEEEEVIKGAAQTGYTYGVGANLARKLVNIPGNLLTPTDLAEEAKELAERHYFDYEVLERSEMEKLGMGALLAVAAGSDQPPKMIVLHYHGNEGSDEVVGFVGKGLTFDSGGISIKPQEKLHEMKFDMGGAAAVLGAMDIIGSLKPKVNVIAVIPSSENMINGSALKPGDVIRSLSGKTIEVRNTDAEGRLILADGMTYAKQLGATTLIDVATLTGAVMVALGDCTTGAVTNNDALMEEVLKASVETGEWIWCFPNHQSYKDMLRSSDVADLNNAPGRLAGSITAGLFVGEFAEGTPWVHLDIAGTAWQSKATNLGPLGGTGVMARTLARLAINRESK